MNENTDGWTPGSRRKLPRGSVSNAQPLMQGPAQETSSQCGVDIGPTRGNDAAPLIDAEGCDAAAWLTVSPLNGSYFLGKKQTRVPPGSHVCSYYVRVHLVDCKPAKNGFWAYFACVAELITSSLKRKRDAALRTTVRR